MPPARDQQHDGSPSLSETPDQRNEAANPQWGGRFAAGPSVVMQEINASIGFDRKLWRQDIRGSLAHAAMLAKVGVIAAQDEQAIRDGLAAIAQRDRDRALPVRRGARGHPHEHRGAPDRAHRRGRPPPAHRAQPQRPGGDGFPPLGARCDRRAVGADRRRDARAGRPRRGACRRSDARLHPSADRAAGDVRPSSAGLCRDAGPRPRPARRLPPPAERMPAGQRGAGRHLVSDRSRDDRAGAGLRPADRQFARCRVGPRLRAGVPWRGGDLGRCICRASPRRS